MALVARFRPRHPASKCANVGNSYAFSMEFCGLLGYIKLLIIRKLLVLSILQLHVPIQQDVGTLAAHTKSL